MSSGDALAGRLLLRPGGSQADAISSSRVDWAAVLTQGQLAAALPRTLGCLYSLCGSAHRLCAGMAVAAAQGHAGGAADRGGPGGSNGGGTPAELRLETLREHLRRICLDWPAQLPARPAVSPLQGESAAALAQCPVFGGLPQGAGNAGFVATQRWLEQQLLGMSAAHWLSCWQSDPAGWLAEWCRGAGTATARCLDQAHEVGCEPLAAVAPLRVHASGADLNELATRLHADAGFSRQPLWQGQPAETGSWTRGLRPAGAAPATPWLRLGARLAEVAAAVLREADAECGRGGAPAWLACGNLATGADEGLAWVETARGLLVHAVRLEGRGDQARVLACRVLAPTEWNFHPQGAVATQVARMPRAPGARELHGLRVLMAAYDPCVRHELETAPETAVASSTQA